MKRQLDQFRKLGLRLDMKDPKPSKWSILFGGFIFLISGLHNSISCYCLYDLIQILNLENVNLLGYMIALVLAQINFMLILFWRDDFRNLISTIQTDLEFLNKFTNQRGQRIAEKYQKYLNLGSKIYDYYARIAFVIYLLVQLIRSAFTGHLNLYVEIFYGDLLNNNVMYPLILFLNIGVCFYAVIIFPLTDTFNLQLILLPATQLKILSDAVTFLKEDSIEIISKDHTKKYYYDSLNRVMIKKLIQCIQLHQRISQYIPKYEMLYSKIILMQYAVTFFCFCFLLFKIVLNGINDLHVTIIIIWLLFQLFTICASGEHLSVKSEELFSEIFHCEWYGSPLTFKCLIILMQERTKRPLKIIVGKIFKLNVDSFSVVIKGSYRIFALLMNLKE